MLDENMALIETPLIAPSNSHFRQHYKTALYPYNITSHTTQAGGGGFYAANENDLNGNGENDGHFSSVEKQSRYQPECANVKATEKELGKRFKVAKRQDGINFLKMNFKAELFVFKDRGFAPHFMLLGMMPHSYLGRALVKSTSVCAYLLTSESRESSTNQ